MQIGKFLTAGALVGFGFAMPQAQATTQTYCGPSICYEYNDAQAAVALFGLPGFVGDSAYFLPTVFEARSADGVGIHTLTNTDFVDATFVFSKIYTVNPLVEIASIFAYEEGDYVVNYAQGEVHGNLYLRARGLNNLLEPSLIATDTFDQVGTAAGLWNMDATVTPAASLTQLANNLTVTVQNQLWAFTSNTTAGSELAWIEKKLTIDVMTVVPVPAAAWLFGPALGLLGIARRRVARVA
jgi:hypothetical protein